MNGRELWDRFASLLYPKRCVLCDQVVEYEKIWCGECGLPVLQQPLCGVCGKPAGDCVCRKEPFGFVRACAPLAYTGFVRDAIIRLKTTPDARTVGFFAGQMAKALAAQQYDCIAPVPMAPGGMARRGHNPAQLLAQGLGRHLDLPLEEGLLSRREELPAQHGLGREGRFSNAKNAYYSTKTPPGNKTILLVDDVLTTGATAHACSELLAALGARVYVVTAATTLR